MTDSNRPNVTGKLLKRNKKAAFGNGSEFFDIFLMRNSRILFPVLLVVISTLAPPRSEGQPNGVTLVGHADIPHGSSSSGFKYSSCWGWVSPDGREYALIGAYNGVSIIDLNG